MGFSHKLVNELLPTSTTSRVWINHFHNYLRLVTQTSSQHLKQSVSQGHSLLALGCDANVKHGCRHCSRNVHLNKSLGFMAKSRVHQYTSAMFGVEHVRKSAFSTSARHLKAVRIDGRAIAEEMKAEIKREVEGFVSQGLRSPHLTVVLVGSDPASVVYVRNKARAAVQTGITCEVLRLPENVSQRALLREIDFLNSLPDVDGILVQLPLPEQLDMRAVCDAVSPDRDVDGFHVLNVGRVCVDQEAFMPATPAGVLEIIRRLGIETFGKNAVVCGRSKNVGMPIAMHLHSSGSRGGRKTGDATTTICHRNTPRDQLVKFTQTADIIVTATGIPGLITADMVKSGAVVIDVGITRVEDDRGRPRLVGDVDYTDVCNKASMITPVPGGVGPVTVAMVIKNTIIAYKKALQIDDRSEPAKR